MLIHTAISRLRLAVLGFALSLPTVAATFDFEWLVGSSNWNTTTNWTPNGLPGATDSVGIDPNNLFNLTLNLDTAATIQSLEIGAGDTLSINNARSLTLDAAGGTSTLIINTGGSLALDSIANNTDLVIRDGSVTLQGGGELNLSNHSNNRIYGGTATETLVNQTTMQGAGALGGNALIIQNEGTITALYATALVFDPLNATASVNTGQMQAADGGLLQLVDGSLTNTTGTLHAANNGQVQLNAFAIENGTLSTTGTGTINVTGASTLSGAVNIATGSDVHINNAQRLDLGESLTLDGTLHLDSIANNTDLRLISASTTISGTGGISLSNHSNNRIYGSSTSHLLINQVVIEGAGKLGANSAGIQNSGTIRALYATPLVLDPSTSSSFSNTGSIEAASGSRLQFGSGSFNNTGGTITAKTGSEVELLSGAAITGGTLSSEGTGFFENVGASSLDGVSLASGTDLRLNNATSISLSNTISNAGTISLNSIANSTDLIVSAAGATLAGGGAVALSDHPNNRIYGSVGTHQLTNQDNTIRGAGQIGVNTLVFDNQGSVEANLDGSILKLDPAATAFTNSGTYTALNGGVLELANGAFDNSSGTISAQANSTVRLTSASVTHGDFDIGSNGTLELSASSFDLGSLTTANDSLIKTTSGTSTLGGSLDLVSAADITIANNSALTLLASGSYTLDGEILLDSIANSTSLIISGGTVTLDGTGKIILDDHANNRIHGAATSNRLVLNGVNVEGGGKLGLNLLGIDNHAVITANDTTSLEIDPSSAGFTNPGTLRADGGTLSLKAGNYDSTGGTVDAMSGSTVEFVSAAFTNGTLTGTGTFSANSGNSFTDLTISSGTTLSLPNNSSTTFFSTLTNHGTVSLTSSANLTNFIAGAGDLSLTGGGTIILGTHANNRIYGTNGSVTLTNVDNTIRGYGQIGVNQLILDNQSTIQADVTGTSLILDLSGSGMTNSGSLRAINGGTLRLQSSTFTNQAGGTLFADSGAHLHFSGITLDDGDVSGAGTIRNIASSTFSDLSLAAGSVLTIDNNTSATFSGTLTNSGHIVLNSVGNITNFISASGGLTLTGNGEIQLSGHANNRLYGANSSTSVTNVDNTIHGYGQLGVNQLILDNQATIAADVSGQTLVVDVSGTGLTNSGQLNATNGGTLRFEGSTITNQTGGSILADTGSSVHFTGSTLIDGTITGDGTVRSLASNTFNDLTLGSSTPLSIDNNTSATFSGTLDNPHEITLNSIGNTTDFVAASSGLTLTGGGTINLTHLNARLYGANSSTTITNTDNTLRGAGKIGVNQSQINNHGTIAADISGQTLTIDTSGFGLVNTGTLQASGGGTLTLSGTLIDNTGGSLEAGSGSTVILSASTVSNGTLSGAGAYTFSTSSVIEEATIDGTTVNVPNTQTGILRGTIQNNGTINVASIGNTTNLVVDATGAQLSGTGEIVLADRTQSRMYGTNSSAVLTNQSGHSIRGAGQLGFNQLHLTNSGTIEANGTNPLTVDLSNPLNNNGTLQATGTGGFIFADDLNNNHDIEVASGSSLNLSTRTFTQNTGLTDIRSGTLTAANLNFDGGELTGIGNVNGAVSFASADLAPDLGTLTFDSTLTLGTGSRTLIELSGTNPATEFGNITAATLTLDGQLHVRFAGGFENTITSTDSFTLLAASDNLSGTFTNLPLGTRLTTFDGFGSFEVNYNALNVTLGDFQPIPEPSTWALLITGTSVLLLNTRRLRRRRRYGRNNSTSKISPESGGIEP